MTVLQETVSREKAQPTEAAKQEAANHATVAQAEFRRCMVLSRDMIKGEIVRLIDVFAEIEPAVNALVERDFAKDPVRAIPELKIAVSTLSDSIRRLSHPTHQHPITGTGRDMEQLLSGLIGSMDQSLHLLEMSRQSEVGRLERAASYCQEVAEKEERHRRRMAGEDVSSEGAIVWP